MLARSFLSASELKITGKARDALIATLHAFERGEARYTDRLKFSPWYTREDSFPELRGFNMMYIFGDSPECGATGCILGWARYFANDRSLFFIRSGKAEDALCDLFMMNNSHSSRSASVTVEEAAAALSNYLTTGKARWDEVL